MFGSIVSICCKLGMYVCVSCADQKCARVGWLDPPACRCHQVLGLPGGAEVRGAHRHRMKCRPIHGHWSTGVQAVALARREFVVERPPEESVIAAPNPSIDWYQTFYVDRDR